MAAGIETFIISAREAGLPLVLLWLLTLAIVYGILSHVKMPQSVSARGVISIVSSFLVLLAAAGTAAASFVTSLVTATVLIAFSLMIIIILIEVSGAKGEGGKHIFAAHSKLFGFAFLILLILVFVGTGGLSFLNLPNITISDPILALGFFLVVMVLAIWVMVKGGEKEK